MSRSLLPNNNPKPPPAAPLLPSREVMDLVAFARARLGFHADPDQVRALDPFIRRGLLNCCRQWGKSTTVAVRAVHQAFHHSGSLTIVAAPSARQSAEFVRKAAGFLRALDIAPRGDGDNEISLAFPNGSRIVGLPGNEAKVRGFSNVALLLVDEASRVQDGFYHALRPMVAANREASIWLMSTPNGRQGFFHEAWSQGDSEWTRIEMRASDCPRINPDFLEEERRTLTDQMFRQEYQCEFVMADFAYFDPESIDDAFRVRDEDDDE